MKNHIIYPGDPQQGSNRDLRGDAEIAFTEVACDIARPVSRAVRAAARAEGLTHAEAETIAKCAFRFTYTVLNATQWMDMPQIEDEEERLLARRGCIARAIEQAVYDELADDMNAPDAALAVGEAAFDQVWEELDEAEDESEEAED